MLRRLLQPRGGDGLDGRKRSYSHQRRVSLFYPSFSPPLPPIASSLFLSFSLFLPLSLTPQIYVTTPLHAAARYTPSLNPSSLLFLLFSLSSSFINHLFHFLSFYISIFRNHKLDALKFVLEKGVDVNAEDNEGETAIMQGAGSIPSSVSPSISFSFFLFLFVLFYYIMFCFVFDCWWGGERGREEFRLTQDRY